MLPSHDSLHAYLTTGIVGIVIYIYIYGHILNNSNIIHHILVVRTGMWLWVRVTGSTLIYLSRVPVSADSSYFTYIHFTKSHNTAVTLFTYSDS